MSRDPRLDFSFSGLKTALLYAIRELGEGDGRRRRATSPLAYQAAVVGQLIAKLGRALRGERVEGGRAGRRRGGQLVAARAHGAALRGAGPPAEARSGTELCTDNAAMIASAARFLDAGPLPGLPSAWDAAA